MSNKKYIIIIPGIFRRESFLRKIKYYVTTLNSDVYIYKVPWLGKNLYEAVYSDLSIFINNKIELGYQVSLIGTSAGASIAHNLYNDSSLNVHCLVTICGPIKDSKTVLFKIGKIISPTWNTSLKISNQNSNKKNRDAILTVIPTFDELVPISTMKIKSAHELLISGYEHLHSIKSATTQYVDKILSFISSFPSTTA